MKRLLLGSRFSGLTGTINESGKHPQRVLVHRSIGPVNNSLVAFAEGEAIDRFTPVGMGGGDVVSVVASRRGSYFLGRL